jgi:LPXTG-site transpeptidase (sortase) family protein
VLPEPEEEDNNQSPTLLPETGFPIGQTTLLTKQQVIQKYTSTELKLEIPNTGVKTSILGVPLVDGDWDVSWLGNQVGYLFGSAYPTWQGNTVLTGHIWNANNTPGIFFNLKTLKHGDLIRIHAYGMVYTYEVRENRLISETNLEAAFQSETYDWITLLTCEGYQPSDKTYAARRMVRAVLVSVE